MSTVPTHIGLTSEYLSILEGIHHISRRCDCYGILSEPKDPNTLLTLTQHGFILQKSNSAQLEKNNYCFKPIMYDKSSADDFFVVSWLTDVQDSQAYDFKELTFQKQDVFIRTMIDQGILFTVFNGLIGEEALSTARMLGYNVDIICENTHFFTTRISTL